MRTERSSSLYKPSLGEGILFFEVSEQATLFFIFKTIQFNHFVVPPQIDRAVFSLNNLSISRHGEHVGPEGRIWSQGHGILNSISAKS